MYTRVPIDSQQGAAMGVMVPSFCRRVVYSCIVSFLFIDTEAADRRMSATTKATTRP
jgi:hypothetical protein